MLLDAEDDRQEMELMDRQRVGRVRAVADEDGMAGECDCCFADSRGSLDAAKVGGIWGGTEPGVRDGGTGGMSLYGVVVGRLNIN